MSAPTPHISAVKGDFAKTVLMPGDPLRAKWIAETFFENARLVNDVRSVQGYTGSYKGAPISVMASGMGVPSIGIYSWELYSHYGVESIIRVGTAGAYHEDIELRDIVIAQGASTNSNFAHQFNLSGTFAPIADFKLLRNAVSSCEEKKIKCHVGNVLTTDNFYSGGEDGPDQWRAMGVLAVEMEAAGLYMNAAHLGKRALAICTISDHFYKDDILSAQERQTALTEMIEIALETAIKMN